MEDIKTKEIKDPWRKKLRELMDLVQVEVDARTKLIEDLKPGEEAKLPEEEQKKRKEEFRKEMSKRNSNIKTLGKEIQEHRMNKTMSKFFQWLPNPNGMNRQQARKLRRSRKRK